MDGKRSWLYQTSFRLGEHLMQVGKAKIFISDEGYGPIVRQSAIIEEFEKASPSIPFDIQTESHFSALQKIIPQANPIKKFNNIRWDKNENGSPDLLKIKDFLREYNQKSLRFIEEEPLVPYDFVISDFVYEAFAIYSARKTPVFGIAHFTWDWFFTKLFPPVLEDYNLIKNWIKEAHKAEILFFPPFTPAEILSCYKNKAIEVPLIVRKKNKLLLPKLNEKPNILIIDSGSKVNQQLISKLTKQINYIHDFNFYIQEGAGEILNESVICIPKEQLLSDYIPSMDLVIGRAGFNTISECIASRVPMMLFSEHMNPEMNENILNMNGIGFGTFIKLSMLESQMKEVLINFFGGEYHSLKSNLMQHEIQTNGAEVITEYILNHVKYNQ